MPLILPGNVGSATAGGYEVANSVVWDSATDAHMHITYGSAGDQNKWSWSGWVKRGTNFTTQQNIFATGTSNVNFVVIYFSTAGKLTYYDATSTSTTAFLDTNAQFRDPSAWMHILISIDTTLGTANNRQRMWVNGTEQTSFANRINYNQDTDTKINGDVKHLLGGSFTGTSNIEFDGRMAEVVFQDGVAHTGAGDFGEFDSDSGIWKPTDVSGLTFGDNGFYLEFKESGTSQNSSGLGADTSGEANHLAVSAMAATDQSTDTCTNNFATLNALDNFYFGGTLSEGNLKVLSVASVESYITNTIAVSTGKWYWEIKITASGSGKDFVGIADKVSNNTNFTPYSGNSQVISYYGDNGHAKAGSTTSDDSYGDTFGAGDIIGVAMDLDNNKLYFSKNGTFQDSGDPTSGSTGTGALAIPASPQDGVYYAQFANIHNTASTFEANFGSPAFAISSGNTDGDGHGNFEFAVPSGYFALCTKNLAEYG